MDVTEFDYATRVEQISLWMTGAGLLGSFFFGSNYLGGEAVPSFASYVGFGGLERPAFIISILLFVGGSYLYGTLSEDSPTAET